MDNNFNQQKKVLLLASLISLAIHTSIFLIVSGANKGETINQNKKPITIKLVEIKTKQQPKVSALKPNNQPPKNKKTPQSIPPLKPRVNKQNDSQKPKGEPAKRKRSLKTEPSVDTGSQAAKTTPAIPTADTSNTRGSESVSKTTSSTSSKESTSIIPKETPRCRQCLEPEKPRRLVKRGIESYAIFKLYISASGKVVKTQLLKSSGHSGWNNAARKAAMSSTFYPMALRNTIEIMYELEIK